MSEQRPDPPTPHLRSAGRPPAGNSRPHSGPAVATGWWSSTGTAQAKMAIDGSARGVSARPLPAGIRRSSASWSRKPAVAARSADVPVQHGVEEAREACVQVLPAQGEHSFSALDAGLDYARLAQHAEVVGERGLGEADLEAAAGPFVAGRQSSGYLEASGVAQSV